MIAFRIAQTKYIHLLDGMGSFLHGGRWTPKGVPAIYTAASRSLAYLEFLVHQFEKPYWAKDLQISSVEINESQIKSIPKKGLDPNWDLVSYQSGLQSVGSDEFQKGVLGIKVPSVIVTEEHNIILNPRHPDFQNLVSIVTVEPFELDPRFNSRF